MRVSREREQSDVLVQCTLEPVVFYQDTWHIWVIKNNRNKNSPIFLCSKVFGFFFQLYLKNAQTLIKLLPKNNSQILYVWGFSFSSYSRIFTLEWRLHFITGKWLQILTYTRHSRPLNCEGSSAYHSFCDTGYPFIMVIFEDLWHSDLLPGFHQWSCHYLFFSRRRYVAAGIRTLYLPHERRTL